MHNSLLTKRTNFVPTFQRSNLKIPCSQFRKKTDPLFDRFENAKESRHASPIRYLREEHEQKCDGNILQIKNSKLDLSIMSEVTFYVQQQTFGCHLSSVLLFEFKHRP